MIHLKAIKKLLLGFIISLFLIQNVYSVVPNTFVDGTVASAGEVNSNFDYFENKFSTTAGHDHDSSDSKTVTTLGTVTSGTWQGTIVNIGYGGTGLSSFATGDLIAATSDKVLTKIATADYGSVLLSNGVYIPFWGKVGLTSHVTGRLSGSNITPTLPVTNLNSGTDADGSSFWRGDGIWSSAVANNQLFTSSGTFTAPTGVTYVYVTMSGGGGGGGGGYQPPDGYGGGGGGSGAYVLRVGFEVVAGNNYTVTVNTGGGGGAGGQPGTAGTNGGSVSFAGIDETLTCNGGTGGGGGQSGSSTGGAGGTATGTAAGSNALTSTGGAAGSRVTTAGATGGNGATAANGGGGGGGAGSPFGKGTAGGNQGAVTSDVTDYGAGGGGGAGKTGGGADQTGGDGGIGFVLVEW